MRATRLEKIMDWIAIVDIAILVIATVALLAGSPALPFGGAARLSSPWSVHTDLGSTVVFAEG